MVFIPLFIIIIFVFLHFFLSIVSINAEERERDVWMPKISTTQWQCMGTIHELLFSSMATDKKKKRKKWKKTTKSFLVISFLKMNTKIAYYLNFAIWLPAGKVIAFIFIFFLFFVVTYSKFNSDLIFFFFSDLFLCICQRFCCCFYFAYANLYSSPRQFIPFQNTT